MWVSLSGYKIQFIGCLHYILRAPETILTGMNISATSHGLRQQTVVMVLSHDLSHVTK